MPIYVVTYDLIAKKNETRDYQPIWDAIDTFPNFQALYSVFLVDAPTKTAVRTALLSALRKNDRYLITRMRPNDFHYRAIDGINEWLEAHPPV